MNGWTFKTLLQNYNGMIYGLLNHFCSVHTKYEFFLWPSDEIGKWARLNFSFWLESLFIAVRMGRILERRRKSVCVSVWERENKGVSGGWLKIDFSSDCLERSSAVPSYPGFTGITKAHRFARSDASVGWSSGFSVLFPSFRTTLSSYRFCPRIKCKQYYPLRKKRKSKTTDAFPTRIDQISA